MKSRKFSKILILSAVVASMTIGMAACGHDDNGGVDPEYVEQLESECVDLRGQNQDLQNQIGDLEQSVVLKSYTLKAIPNEAGDGATVEIAAAPMRYEEGQKALFRVLLNEEEVAAAEGTWDGNAYTASVELAAEDGYFYECILTQADGSEGKVCLSSLETPLYESCVYLASGLNAYCNLIVEDWIQEDGKLTLTTGYAQVQLPRIDGYSATYEAADLVLNMGGEELERVPVEIPEGEGEGSREAILENIVFDMPELKDNQQMDLILEVRLSNGKLLTYTGCSWFISDGALAVAVG